ncbi:hypothetical protein VD0002_g2975 [Verticillium dahliae]|uniref:Uncharacterized protein n=3 Tax=Verticillium TaxID=1036719 RepID=G2WSY2_VERDV|nr:uncharacterized protein VDAG_00905 [Verticillium dahliae VdLs.17]KAF3348762.1 Pre-mRNA-splicing factor ATP-dependent RNA helicase prp22 [Verticillium dahliae VDG2]KAF3357698.1 hypothetical protein VdG1_05801 [Verticillium dahliae VDG1]KAH6701682.1 hypothetical protein EV126DRAFT_339651 [Verticillium dahliae]EGY17223.1 hypothetical protein VDAG_00905 [Verticillium dahliae VdLs.17]PNH32537.1 hypothetical protein BJF96_g4240 [Verticillium dahliae]
MSRQEILRAYRHLYRGLLRAVQFSVKGRYTARDQLRAAFRDKNATFEAESVKRTIWFINSAALERGLEHSILKNLIRTAYARQNPETWRSVVKTASQPKKKTQQTADDAVANGMKHYDMTVAMLNKTMGLCLR